MNIRFVILIKTDTMKILLTDGRDVL